MSKDLFYPIDDEVKLKLQNILSSLTSLKESSEFLEPVDFIKYNIPDYPKVIKYPRDLNLIKYRLENNIYKTLQEFVNDVQLVWDNCHTYNPPKNQITQCARICEQKFKNEFNKIFNCNLALNEEFSHDNIGINEKMELKERINQLIEKKNYKGLNNLKNYCLKIVPFIIEIDNQNNTYTINFCLKVVIIIVR